MNAIKLTIILLIAGSNLCAQAVKKTPATKQTVPAKTNLVLQKVLFIKRNLTLDTTMFSTTVDSIGSRLHLVIKSKLIPSAYITLSDASSTPVSEMTKTMEEFYTKNRFTPTKGGFTYQSVGVRTNLQYENRSIEPVEYKAVFNGTEEQRRVSRAQGSKLANEFDNDANNWIERMYFLNYGPDIDKGFIHLNYSANFGGDRKNDGPKILQTIVSGLSRMKITEVIKFSVMKEPKLKIDFVLPPADGSDGSYYFSKGGGGFKISEVPDATAGYAAIIDNTGARIGTITAKTPIERNTLYNGIKIFSSVRSMERKSDDYTSVWYDYVTVLVPDNKIIKKPILIRFSCYSTDPVERDELNAFILNSISAPGKLTDASLDKVHTSFAKP
jgi:hypothetical protein